MKICIQSRSDAPQRIESTWPAPSSASAQHGWAGPSDTQSSAAPDRRQSGGRLARLHRRCGQHRFAQVSASQARTALRELQILRDCRGRRRTLRTVQALSRQRRECERLVCRLRGQVNLRQSSESTEVRRMPAIEASAPSRIRPAIGPEPYREPASRACSKAGAPAVNDRWRQRCRQFVCGIALAIRNAPQHALSVHKEISRGVLSCNPYHMRRRVAGARFGRDIRRRRATGSGGLHDARHRAGESRRPSRSTIVAHI